MFFVPFQGADVTGKNREEFIAEANLMMSLRPHENVVFLKGWGIFFFFCRKPKIPICSNFVFHPTTTKTGICENPLCIVTQYLLGGSLNNLVKEKDVEMKVLIHIAAGVAKGLNHLHCEGAVFLFFFCFFLFFFFFFFLQTKFDAVFGYWGCRGCPP